MMKIGIIGYGFVGKAVAAAYEPSQLLINDPLLEDSVSLTEIKTECDAVFVCVPTPQNKDGSCDTSALVCVLEKLQGYTGLVISKSTAVPQVYAELESRYSDLKFAHVPEFLTAANSVIGLSIPS